jgi:hypothetical protein
MNVFRDPENFGIDLLFTLLISNEQLYHYAYVSLYLHETCGLHGDSDKFLSKFAYIIGSAVPFHFVYYSGRSLIEHRLNFAWVGLASKCNWVTDVWIVEICTFKFSCTR